MTKFTLAFVVTLVLGSASNALAQASPTLSGSGVTGAPHGGTTPGEDAPGSTMGPRDGRQIFINRR